MSSFKGEGSLSASSSDDDTFETVPPVISTPKKRKVSENGWKSNSNDSSEHSSPTYKRKTTYGYSSGDEKSDSTQRKPKLDNLEDIAESDSSGSDETSTSESVMSPGFTPKLSVAQQMMSKMGYKTGTGLGKHGQGRTEIIEASKQRGRRGLGLRLAGLEPSDINWDSNSEFEPTAEEIVKWIPDCQLELPIMSELRTWSKEGPRKLTIEHETSFCDEDLLRKILSGKSVFDNLEPEEMRKARTKSNPFETIRGGMFLNRAAMKMANMDAVFDYMFTNPKDENGAPILSDEDILFFADICAGPGGFSEYVLWRKQWRCKGFGLTLKSMNDFKLEGFYAGPPETFEPYYGENGYKGDGDIYKSANLRAFKSYVLENTYGKGVHFVMADGGFSVEGEENIQEILSKRLYLCQFLLALYILRQGGHFVCKIFDLFTPFSVGLVYLLYRAFKQVSIHKPNTSRPANSERYVICKWKRENTKDLEDYLFEININLEGRWAKEQDIIEVVPMEKLQDNQEFFNYIVESNNSLGERQIVSLAKIQAFAKNEELYEKRQSEIRKACLEKWNIPDKLRAAPKAPEPFIKFKEMMMGERTDFLKIKSEELTLEKLNSINSIYDYQCTISGAEKDKSESGIFMGLGRSHIFRFDPFNGKWIKVDTLFELPPNTVIYAEIITELKGESRAQRKIKTIHVIDVLIIGGEKFFNIPLAKRLKYAAIMVKTVSKPSRTDHSPISLKEYFGLDNVEEIFNRLEMKSNKGSSNLSKMCYKTQSGLHFVPQGLYVFKTIEEPWTTTLSKTSGKMYYFNKRNKQSSYEEPDKASSSFKNSFSSRLLWSWTPAIDLTANENPEGKKKDLIHRQTFVNFIRERLM